MKRIKKYLGGSYFRLPSLSSEFQTGASYVTNVPYINTLLQQYITNTGNFSAPIPTSSKVKDNTLKDTVSNIGSSIIGKASDAVSDKIFGDSELGRNLGTIFSSGLNSVGDTVLNNAIKKAALTDGLTKNLGSSVGGAVAGLGANYLGRGITSILGNNAASRFLGLSASTVGGTIGGKILSSGTKNLFSGPGSINPIGLGMSAVGAGLSAATGPSKEYNGTYGSTTKALDTVYDALQAGISFVPGWGLIASGAMALNKGLSNIFGSTDGMTTLDAILGSAFMPAPIKWLNMLGSSKTGTFNNQSWLNTLKTSNFMQNAFGDLEDKFSKAREEAGKTYGTFSQGAKKRALNNIDFSNFAWNKILNMADLNEYQNIRSSDMASINNLRYALWILGGFSPLARGKNGMKIFNNSINHNLGLRLLSGAALIDNKQMILSALNGTKIKKKGIKSGINVDYYDPNNVMSVVANNPNKTIVLDELTIKPNARQRLGYYMKNAPAADIDKVMLGTLALGSAPIAALAAIPSVSTLGDYIAGTKLVNVGNKVITNPYVSSAIESAFAGHGLNHAVNEGIDGWGDAAMTALEITPLGRLARPMYNAGKEAVYNIADRYMFMPHQNSFTRGIGGEAGLQDLIESGLVRGNPVGTETTAKAYGKLTRSNRNNFNDIMRDTGLKDIEHRFYNRTLTEEDFNAIKKAALKYKTENPSLGSQNKITLLRPDVDPLSRYSSYQDYQAKLASDRQTLANATSLDDSGQPLAYFYDNGRNPLTAGHDYAASDYGVRINNASEYNPRIFEGHLHYSMPKAVPLRDPNVEIFGKGPLGLTVKLDKETLQPLWKKDLSNIFKGNKVISPQITVENASKITPRITTENTAIITPKQWATAAQDAENTLSGLLPNAKPLVAEENPWITTANANDVLAHPSTGRRFQLYKDVYEKEIPKEVKQIYRNAVLPRLQKTHSDYLPLQELTRESVEKALSKDYTVYPERVFKDAGKNNTVGLAFPDGHIAIKEGYEDYAVGHEVRHRLQYLSAPQPMKELKLLDDAYDANFVNLGREYPEFEGLNLDIEKETLNYDARRSLVGDDVLKKFDLDTQNAIIDDMSDIDIFDAVEEADGYGRAYIDFLRKNNLLTHKKAQQFREAMKHVGAYAAPVGVAIGTSAATLYNKSNKNKNIR